MDLFSPDSKNTDILITKILTPLFGYNNSGNNLFYSEVMQSFLTGVLILCGILFIFNTVTYITNSANTGFILGRKSSLTWNVLRQTVGIALLIPFKSGMCVAQLIFIWLIGQGLLFANTLYEKMNFLELQSQNLTFVSTIQTDLLDVYKNATFANLCILELSKLNNSQNTGGKNYNFGIQTTTSKDNIVYKFGNLNAYRNSEKSICGQITVAFPKIKKNENITITDKLEDLATFNLIDKEKVSSELRAFHMNEMKELILRKSQESAKLIMMQNEDLDKKLAQKISDDLNSYESNIKAKFNKINYLNNNIKELTTKYGIASSGAWFFALSSTQNSLTNIVNDTPKVISVFNNSGVEKDCTGFLSYFSEKCSVNKEISKFSPTLNGLNQKAFTTFKNAELLLANNLVENVNENLVVASNKNIENEDALSKFVSMFSNFDLVKLMTTERTNQSNPLLAISTLGQYILGGLSSVVSILLVSSLFSSFAISATLVALPLIITLSVSAIYLVFYIPFLPFIIWLGNLIGWIVLIVQGLIGIPLWIISFLRDADDFVGKTGQGYMLVLEAFLRPSLMILALFFAFNLMIPTIDLLNFFFLFVGKSIYSNTSSFYVIFYYIFMIVIYAVLVNKIVMLLLNLIEQIPNKILLWLGSNINSVLGNLGKELDNTTTESTQRTLSQVGAVGGAVGNIATNTLKERLDNRKNEKLNSQFENAITNSNKFEQEINRINSSVNSKNTTSSNANNANVSNVVKDKFDDDVKKI